VLLYRHTETFPAQYRGQRRQRQQSMRRLLLTAEKPLYDKKEHDKAINAFTDAIWLAQNNAHFYYNRGIAYHDHGENGTSSEKNKISYFDEVIIDFTEAIRLDPNFASAYHNRGFAYVLTGKPPKGQR
jgi:tetratricopeptide (TPR) repeat protein